MVTIRVCPACGVDLVDQRDAVEVGDPWYGTEGSFTFVSCQNPQCRSLVQVPVPSAPLLDRAYSHYYTHTIEDSLLKQILQNLFGGRLKSLRLPESRGRVLLDFGCGDGKDMVALRDLGWDVLGIDTDAAARAAAQQRGLLVYASLADLPTATQIDVVLLRHVVEHVLDPAAFLRSLLPFLSDGASLVIVTPNCDAVGRRVFKRYWRGYDAPRHLQIFTPDGLSLLIRRSGYRPDSVHTAESSPGGMHSESFAHMIARLGAPPWVTYVLGRLGGLFLSFTWRVVRRFSHDSVGEEIFARAVRSD